MPPLHKCTTGYGDVQYTYCGLLNDDKKRRNKIIKYKNRRQKGDINFAPLQAITEIKIRKIFLDKDSGIGYAGDT